MRTLIVASLSFSAVCAVAPHTHARPFVLSGYEAGGGLAGLLGDGFTTTGAGFYNPTGALTNSDVQPAPASLPWSDAQSYDSYFTLSQAPARITAADGGGDTLSPQILSFYGYTDSLDAPVTIAATGSHIGATGDNDGFGPYPVVTPVERARAGIMHDASSGTQALASAINPRSGQHGVFIAQLTLNRGASLAGGIVARFIAAPGDVRAATLMLNGPAALVETSPGLFEFVRLRSYVVGQHENLGHSRSGGNVVLTTSGRFGAADVWHLWVEVVPTPGAVGVFALAGIAASRRRRGSV